MVRKTHDIKLPRWRKGMSILARRLDAMSQAINRNAIGTNQASNVPITGRSYPRRLILISQDGDFLTCTTPDGFDAGEPYEPEILVAKPYLLRRTPFDAESRDGITYTYSSDSAREADDGSDTEDQVIVPTYVEGDEIYATRVIGGTGVTDDSDEVAEYIDVNDDGRAWASVEEEST